MSSSDLIIKVGGSLCSPALLSPLAKVVHALAASSRVVIVPGGGAFADLVRDWDQRLHLGETASHWMAVAAMNQYGLLLESLGVGAAVDDPAVLMSTKGPVIFLPYNFLRAADPLPHSWSVTSDSIAAYLASVLRIRSLVLIKALDPPESPYSLTAAIEAKIIDPCFGCYLAKDAECWIVNGNHPRRLLQLQSLGTRLIADANAKLIEH